jgi:Flp pilus assembly protein TadD
VSRHLLLHVACGLLASAAFAGCATSMRTAADDAPPEVLAEASANKGWWNRTKSWMPKPPAAVAQEQEVQNPGKLYLSYAHLQESVGNLIAAREAYEQALGNDPKSAEAILGLARLDQLNGRTYEAEQRYLKALKLKPKDPHVLDAVGQFYASQERWDKAIELLSEAMRVAPEASGHRFNLAVALTRAGRIDEAMPHFSRTVGNAEAHYNVGYILYQQNDFAGAERHLVQAVVARPGLTQAQQMLDEVRHNRDGQLMFAGGQPAQGRGASRHNRPGGVQPVGASHAAADQGNRQRGMAPPRPPAVSTPHDYRTGDGQSQSAGAPLTARPAPAHSKPAQSAAAWQTSASAPPPSAPAPGMEAAAAGSPTPEQLEQWQNQFSP